MPWHPMHIAILPLPASALPAAAWAWAPCASTARIAPANSAVTGFLGVRIRNDRFGFRAKILSERGVRLNLRISVGPGRRYNRGLPKDPLPMRFAGSEEYVSTEDLTLAVNAAITLERPLLIKGEPGT